MYFPSVQDWMMIKLVVLGIVVLAIVCVGVFHRAFERSRRRRPRSSECAFCYPQANLARPRDAGS